MKPKRKGKRHARPISRRIQHASMGTPGQGEGAGPVAPSDQPAAPVEDNRPRRVVLDNNVPGGFRMEPV